MNLCKPPNEATRSAVGRNIKWYVLPKIISAPVDLTISGVMALTVPHVPTGINAGV